MMKTAVEPKPEFQPLTEGEVLEACKHSDRTNLIAQEVARLIEAYSPDFELEIRRLGYIPSIDLEMKPRWPIEAIALQLTADTIREKLHKDMATVLQDIVNLCDTGEFQPAVFLDFVRSRKTRNLMQYHRDYSQKHSTH